ncbi:MAG: hypothetical protein JJLCMIEE_00894 [Acidimicrobiales bacterium]|nr:MAG: hypothetical protein EDR02_10975 [Actinomycetota bacterium]MBV6507836.1 hypothetical protein [Acidimicrobiales bacterium]RIK05988.1 MAG: hypothetical protein DCC48_08515 [Acidobacteriota bacterium]
MFVLRKRHRAVTTVVMLAPVALSSGCVIGTSSDDVAQLSEVAVERGPEDVGKVATRIRANEAAAAWETFAFLEFEAGSFDLTRREDGQLVDANPQVYINRYGPESSFVVEGEDGELEMIPPDEMTALQQMAFRAWLQNPLVIEATEPQVRELLEGSDSVEAGTDEQSEEAEDSTTSTTAGEQPSR